MALLNKKMGSYRVSIGLYLQLLNSGLNYPGLKKELWHFEKEVERRRELEK